MKKIYQNKIIKFQDKLKLIQKIKNFETEKTKQYFLKSLKK